MSDRDSRLQAGRSAARLFSFTARNRRVLSNAYAFAMRTLFEYDLYFPMAGAGANAELDRVRKVLTESFGGLTDFRHRSVGLWKMGGVTFHDEIVLLRVLGDDRERARGVLQRIGRELAASLGQEEILIVEREVVALGEI